MQLTEHKETPEQSPQLIGVGKRNSSANAEIFGCVLLKKIANHPDKAAQHQPEQNIFCLRQLEPQSVCSAGFA